jgi:hypothetical protein
MEIRDKDTIREFVDELLNLEDVAEVDLEYLLPKSWATKVVGHPFFSKEETAQLESKIEWLYRNVTHSAFDFLDE